MSTPENEALLNRKELRQKYNKCPVLVLQVGGEMHGTHLTRSHDIPVLMKAVIVKKMYLLADIHEK